MIQSPNTENPNAAETIGTILEKFRVAQGWGPDQDDSEHALRIMSFLEILGTAQIPAKHWDRLYQKAMVARGVRKSQGTSSPYWITPEDFIAEWPGLQYEFGAETEDPLGLCGNIHFDEDERTAEYSRGFNEPPTILPCHECRRNAHFQRIRDIKSGNTVQPKLTDGRT